MLDDDENAMTKLSAALKHKRRDEEKKTKKNEKEKNERFLLEDDKQQNELFMSDVKIVKKGAKK